MVVNRVDAAATTWMGRGAAPEDRRSRGVGAIVMFFLVSALELLVMFLQAYVFTLLTAMYVAGAVSEEH